MSRVQAALATLVAFSLLLGCGSKPLAPTDAEPRDSASGDRTGALEGGVGCTPGQDQTCNDDPTAITNRGVCLSDGTCQCLEPCLYSATGRCLNPTCGCGALCRP